MDWTTIDYPGELGIWNVSGIHDNMIVGNTHNVGFIFDGINWTTFSYPGAPITLLEGVYNNKLVGSYCNNPLPDDPEPLVCHGFLYDGSSLTTIDYPGAVSTWPQSIKGNMIVGYYDDGPGGWNGFVYNGSNWTTLDYPGAVWTQIYDIDGSRIVGSAYFTDAGNYAFLYDGVSWNPFNYPGMIAENIAVGIDGNRIVCNLLNSSYLVTFQETGVPDLNLENPQPTDYWHPDSLTLAFSATGSGEVIITAVLDQTPVTNGQEIDLYTLPLGNHTLTVHAVDSSGNEASESVTFSVVATVQSLQEAVNRFYSEGKIKKAGIRNSLLSKLMNAQKFVNAGKTKAGINLLNAYINEVKAQTGKAIASKAAALLIEDTRWVISHLP
jgi:hypothetical protein